MSLIAKVIGGITGGALGEIGKVIKAFVTTDKDRLELQSKMEEILQKRDSEIEQTIRAEMSAKERILVAELTQGDNFTKRARPTILYSGVVFIGINNVVFPIVSYFAGMGVPHLELPQEFWWTWGSISSVYAIGRSAEKRGVRSKLTSLITGS